MAVTPAAFRARFPEFVRQNDTYLQVCIDAAYVTLDADVWGDLLDEGVRWQVATELAAAPAGIAAGLSTIRFKSSYQAKFDLLKRAVAGGMYAL